MIWSYNSNGQQQWIKTYNGVEFTGVIKANNGYIVLGTNCKMIKYDTSGNVVWEKIYPYGTNCGTGKDIVSLENEFFVLATKKIIKYNSNGVFEWEKGLVGTGIEDAGECIKQVSDGYVVVGGTSQREAVIMKYTADWEEEWLEKYKYNTKNNINIFSNVIETGDGFVVVGHTDFTNVNPSDPNAPTKFMHNALIAKYGRAVPLISIALNKTNTTIEKGGTETLIATCDPINTTDDTTITWTSDKPSIATVSNGVVTAIASGTATITAKTADGSKTATCTVTVTVPVTGVTLSRTTRTVDKGESFTLTATVAPTDASNKTVTWDSNNTSVATVLDGVVTAVEVGTATITATTTDGGKTATCIVTVKEIDSLEYVIIDSSLREDLGYISNIDITNNTVDYIKSKIDTNLPIIEVYKNGQLIEGTTKIGTGTRIVVKRSDGTIFKEYTIIIYGDVDGDGKITTADALMVQRFAVRLETFDEIQKTAGNTRGTGTNPTTADALNIQRHAVRLYTIPQ